MEHAFLIHLPHRYDRLQYIQTHYPFLRYEVFPAIQLHPGRRGCALSHIGVIKQAKANVLPYVIAMEDDLLITDPSYFIDKLPKVMDYLGSLPDGWDIFNGGINKTHTVHLQDKDLNILHYDYAYCLHFVIYHSRVYDKMIALEPYYLENNTVEPIDVIINDMFDKKYTTVPFLCYQHNSYSDVDKLFAPNYYRIRQEERVLMARLQGKDVTP